LRVSSLPGGRTQDLGVSLQFRQLVWQERHSACRERWPSGECGGMLHSSLSVLKITQRSCPYTPRYLFSTTCAHVTAQPPVDTWVAVVVGRSSSDGRWGGVSARAQQRTCKHQRCRQLACCSIMMPACFVGGDLQPGVPTCTVTEGAAQPQP